MANTSTSLFDAVSVRRREGTAAPRSFSDYEVTLDGKAVPEGVTIHERV